jgi:hypothetical protein
MFLSVVKAILLILLLAILFVGQLVMFAGGAHIGVEIAKRIHAPLWSTGFFFFGGGLVLFCVYWLVLRVLWQILLSRNDKNND